ncbi:hypothetical protein [Mycolicibacterium hodleri]|uniref:Transmembrane protein n=1 Tax=Mycolicibacterium hodleri TaxID=49897 RepID=A0A502E3U3_9MYCO|nr:hypothetical protein [Mycolicibacterium hodleri]TPG32187.1 hypothetical protein EAH80_20390 [Mycolicibacterium hodleri]
MPEALRIALRVLGLALLAICVTSVVLLFRPGPAGVAEAMGVTCGDDRSSMQSHQCSSFDAVSVLWTVIWVSFVAGVTLRIGTRPAGRAPRTLDLRWLRAR